MAGVAAVVSIVSAGYTIYEGQQQKDAADAAAKEQEKFALENAAAIESETAESVRRAENAAEDREALARARAGASGASDGGMFDYIDEMEKEHDRELEWMAQAGATRARLTIAEGKMAADMTRAGGSASRSNAWSSGIQQGSAGVSYGSDAGWWS